MVNDLTETEMMTNVRNVPHQSIENLVSEVLDSSPMDVAMFLDDLLDFMDSKTNAEQLVDFVSLTVEVLQLNTG